MEESVGEPKPEDQKVKSSVLRPGSMGTFCIFTYKQENDIICHG